MTGAEQLRDLIGKAAAGEAVDIAVSREGSDETLQVTLKEKAGRQQAGAREQAAAGSGPQQQAAEQDGSQMRLGVRVVTLDEGVAQQLGIERLDEGVVVVAVRRGGAAAEAGIEPGDVIVSAGGKMVTQPRDIVDELQSAEKSGKESVAMRVFRDGSYRFVSIGG